MALDDGKYTVKGKLFLNPTDYTGAGGTDLGLLETFQLAGFNHDVEMLTKQNYGTHYVDARLLATNVAYQVTVANRSTELSNIFLHGRASSDNFGVSQPYLYGNLVGASQLSKLLIVPDAGATKPYLYIPRALVIDVGPVVWDRRQSHVDLASMVIVALWDTTINAPVLYGDPTTWSVLQPAVP